jgi:hypothetical protein
MSGKHILTNSNMEEDHPKKSARIAPIQEHNLRGSENSAMTLENENSMKFGNHDPLP